MFCVHCGIGLPTDANFCRRCGAPQRACLSRPKEEALVSRWEICRITVEPLTSKRTWRGRRAVTERYRADAVGPDGPYLAAASLAFRSSGAGAIAQSDERRTARDTLIQQLLGEGWFPRSDDLFVRRLT